MRTLTLPTLPTSFNDCDMVIKVDAKTLATAIAENGEYADEVIQALAEKLGDKFYLYAQEAA